MRQFRFRLERVAQWQLQVCHVEEENTRLCVLAVSETEEKLAQLRTDRLAAEQDLLSHRAIAATELKAWARFRIRVVAQERLLSAQRQSRIQALQEQRQKLLAERNRLRRIERIRERALQRHTEQMNKELEALALECHLSKWDSAARL